MPLRNLLLVFVTVAVSLVCYHKRERSRFAGTFSEALVEIQNRYVKRVDDRKLFEDAMNGMVGALDQHSIYMGPEKYELFKLHSIAPKFDGIGIEVREIENRLVVTSPLFGGPAHQAGIEADDQILAVDGTSTKGMELKAALNLIKGSPGTTVELTVLHEGESNPIKIKVKRGTVRLESVRGDRRGKEGVWLYRLLQNPRIKYIRITRFAEQTAEDVSALLQQFKKKNDFDGLVLDLRGNSGGLLTEAVAICDLFISKGMIVTINGRDDIVREEYPATDSGTYRDIPIAVLIDGGSASASEIVAACLQDHDRAAIIGTQSYGKGSVQNMIELEGGRSVLKLTTARYLPPSGRNIHKDADNENDNMKWGVRPDKGRKVELTDQQAQELFKDRVRRDRLLSEKRRALEEANHRPLDDPQIDKAVEYLDAKLKAFKGDSRANPAS